MRRGEGAAKTRKIQSRPASNYVRRGEGVAKHVKVSRVLFTNTVKSKFVCKFLWVLVNRVYGSMLQEEELSKDTKPPREFPLQTLVIRASSGCKYIPLLSGHLLKKI